MRYQGLRRIIHCIRALVSRGFGHALWLGAIPLAALAQERGSLPIGRLDFGQRGFCSGSLIAPDLVLTAGHCLFDTQSGVSLRAQMMRFRPVDTPNLVRIGRDARANSDYVYGGFEKLERARFDLALVALEPAQGGLPAALPLHRGRFIEAKLWLGSLEKGLEPCNDLQPSASDGDALLVLDCVVDFGVSGAPVLAEIEGEMRVVAVVVAKAEHAGGQVSLAAPIGHRLDALLDEFSLSETP